MGQKLSYSAACDQLEEELGIRGPFLGSRDAGTSISLQRVVCLVSEHGPSLQPSFKTGMLAYNA